MFAKSGLALAASDSILFRARTLSKYSSPAAMFCRQVSTLARIAVSSFLMFS